ncbi:MAG: type II toxin-antitoxin system YoeB family toxin [Capnocytophaga sp.]|nr:type II toxin-antitoxin system YoeB family toxin [Capnocytophaga sp.]
MHKKSGKTKLINKIIDFHKEIKEHPKKGTGQIEQLKGYKERSVWSRRTDQKHRLTYEVFESEKRIVLLSAYGHYEDK